MRRKKKKEDSAKDIYKDAEVIFRLIEASIRDTREDWTYRYAHAISMAESGLKALEDFIECLVYDDVQKERISLDNEEWEEIIHDLRRLARILDSIISGIRGYIKGHYDDQMI